MTITFVRKSKPTEPVDGTCPQDATKEVLPYALMLGDCLDVLKGMPDNYVDSIVTDPPAPRIELFARVRVDGWDAWGNEVDSDVDLFV